jgi:hypothetical protein
MGVVQLDSGKLRLFDLKNKWSSIVAGNNKLLVTKTLSREDVPVYNGLEVWDSESGKRLWSADAATFKSLEGNSVYYLKDDLCFKISFPTAHALQANMPLLAPFKWQFPQAYLADNPWFDTIAKFIQAKTGNIPVWQCDYLEYEPGIFVMYYICAGKNFEQHLTVFDESGAVVMQLTLAKELKARTLQTFFIGQKRLICVQDNDKILTYKIL